MNKALIGASLGSAAIIILAVVILNGLISDINDPIRAAEEAADAKRMSKNLRALLQKMDVRCMSGYFWFKKIPENDIDFFKKRVGVIVSELESIDDLPENSVSYKKGIERLRNEIRNLPRPAWRFFFVRCWSLIVFAFAIWLWPLATYLRGAR